MFAPLGLSGGSTIVSLLPAISGETPRY